MILPNLTTTPDQAVLTLDDGHPLILRTPTAARQVRDLCRAAEQYLVEAQMARAARLDREAADGSGGPAGPGGSGGDGR